MKTSNLLTLIGLALWSMPSLGDNSPENFIANNSTVYLSVPDNTPIYLPTILKNNERALYPHIVLPGESIIAVDTNRLAQVLENQERDPSKTNYPFMRKGDDRPRQSNDGFLCGFRVVDATSEEVRDNTLLDRTDFCMELDTLREATSLESNGEEIQDAFQRYAESKNSAYITQVASSVAMERIRLESSGVVAKTGFSAPLSSPLKGCTQSCLTVTSEYGSRYHPVHKRRILHKGIDFRASIGTEVSTALPGKVLAVRTERNARSKKIVGYGHYVIVSHPESRMETLYAHLSQFKIKQGASVKAGDLIALSGNSGVGTGPHLHFETHVANKGGYKAVDPRTFLTAVLETVTQIINFFSLKA